MSLTKREVIKAMLDGKEVTLDYLKGKDRRIWGFNDKLGFYTRIKGGLNIQSNDGWGDEIVNDSWEIYEEPKDEKIIEEFIFYKNLNYPEGEFEIKNKINELVKVVNLINEKLNKRELNDN